MNNVSASVLPGNCLLIPEIINFLDCSQQGTVSNDGLTLVDQYEAE